VPGFVGLGSHILPGGRLNGVAPLRQIDTNSAQHTFKMLGAVIATL
jgi:hypothetical protein